MTCATVLPELVGTDVGKADGRLFVLISEFVFMVKRTLDECTELGFGYEICGQTDYER